MNRVRHLVRSPFVWLLCAALVLRILAVFVWHARLPQERQFEFADSESYWALAECIAHGKPYEFGTPPSRVFRTPGYPTLLAGLFVAAGDEPPIVAARLLSAVLGTLAVAGVYALGWQLFDPRTALVAGGIAAIYPGAIGMSVFVLSEAPFCPLFLAQLVVTVCGWQSPTPKASLAWTFLSGILGGAATLMRPSWLLWIPFTVAAGLVTGRNLGKHLAYGAAAFCGLALVMAPWWVRNARITDHFVPTTLQVGASLYDGWNPAATGASDMQFVPEFAARVAAEPDLAKPGGAESLEYRLDKRLRDAALDWARANPSRVASLAVTKFLRLWNIWPNDTEFRGRLLRATVALSYVPVMALALVGAWRFSRRGWIYAICWLPALYFTLLHMVFVSSLRYRDPVMLPLAVLAGATIVDLWPRSVMHSPDRAARPSRALHGDTS